MLALRGKVAQVAVVGAIVATLVGGATAIVTWAGAGDAAVPADANQATFNGNPPANQLHAVSGALRTAPEAQQIALRAIATEDGGPPTVVTGVTLTTYGGARTQLHMTGVNFSIGLDRQVFVVTLRGGFVFYRVPRGHAPIQAADVYVMVDAATGDVLEDGTLV